MSTAEAIEAALEKNGTDPAAIGAGMATAALSLEPLSGLQIANAVGAAGVYPVWWIFERTASASNTEYGQSLAETVVGQILVGR